ncbi:MAG TPA: LemA family protein [Steroidobacteraceae bacterium]|nr:LemA family protein [Steroidobacteraceae bacterium]
MTGLIIFLLIVVLLIGYTATMYNGLVRTRNEVKLAWSNIDVLLVQRHDELPKLVDVCKQYMQHERETLERVTQARSQVEAARHSGDVASVSAAEGVLRSGLANLYAVAERYPDLKADTMFRNLAARISALETAIADRREIYNDAANAQNVRIETFPDAMIASLFNFAPARLLKFDAAQTADVNIGLAFGK